ncbi:hypothetical protein [Novipirellula rosea]|uniref:Uncharacterized protein n=1 Tax=Novipirellula rosea TaxID=1031540 RepID=A0ABP8MFQ3_9BACT
MDQAKYNELMLRCFNIPKIESMLVYFIDSLSRFIEAHEEDLHTNWGIIHQLGEWLSKHGEDDRAPERVVVEMKPPKNPSLPSEITNRIGAEMWEAVLPKFKRVAELKNQTDRLLGRSDYAANCEFRRLLIERNTAMDDVLNLYRDYRVGCFLMLDEVRKQRKDHRVSTAVESNAPEGFLKLKPVVQRWLELPSKLGGPTKTQHDFVLYLVEQNGRAKPADISTACGLDYEDPRDGCRKMVTRIQGKITDTQPWDITAEDRGEVAIFERPQKVLKTS